MNNSRIGLLRSMHAVGDMFVGVSDVAPNDLPYTQTTNPHGTNFCHTATSFTGNWEPLTCDVDNIFKVAHINMEVSGSDSYDTKPLVSLITGMTTFVVFVFSDWLHVLCMLPDEWSGHVRAAGLLFWSRVWALPRRQSASFCESEPCRNCH